MDNLIGWNFINMIKSIRPEAKPASGGKEVVVACPFCGDSSSRDHNHLYIGVPSNNNEPSLYDCKRCPAHGMLDDSVLRKLGCYDASLLVAISQRNEAILRLPRYKILKGVDIYPLSNFKITNNKFTALKLKYINERLGLNLSYNDILRLKIFINLADVVIPNRLELTRDEQVCQQLSSHFIGFISYDNSFAMMRRVFNKNLISTINFKYINYTLVNKLDESKNYYVVPTTIDVASLESIKIHIAEGVFDILSIYYNINKCCNMQSVYIAAGGKSYRQALEFILTETGMVNYEIHLYPDIDVSNKEFDKLVLRDIMDLPCCIYVHRNMHPNEKDYGVPIDHINDAVNIISRGDLYG